MLEKILKKISYIFNGFKNFWQKNIYFIFKQIYSQKISRHHSSQANIKKRKKERKKCHLIFKLDLSK